MPSAKLSLVITDASCLILLDKIEYLDLLPKLFDVVITTPEIALEYGKTIPKWLTIIKVHWQRRSRSII
jgi:predicted nucleic acid-binding protein